MTSATQKSFQKHIWKYYHSSGRDFAWRNTKDPYAILLSEIMLQQTHVSRVEEKYPQFLSVFPTVAELANASLASVVRAWQGMGYNRRAKHLKHAAEIITEQYSGYVPDAWENLVNLPGIGPATTGGVLSSAFNKPVVFIETNIRRVFIHHFFQNKEGVGDREILPLVEQTLDHHNPREWYWALFDYGTHLAKHPQSQ